MKPLLSFMFNYNHRLKYFLFSFYTIIFLISCGGGSGENLPKKNPSGTFSFTTDQSNIDESIIIGKTTLIVSRIDGSDGNVSVQFKTNEGASATDGQDFIAISDGVLNFPEGIKTQSIEITILDDLNKNEGIEAFSVSLFNPSDGASLGVLSTHTVNIIDNDILSIEFGLKQIKLSWLEYPLAKFYKLTKKTAATDYQQVGDNIPITISNKTIDIAVHKYDWVNSSYRLEACDIQRCIQTNEVTTLDKALNTVGYFKASNPFKLDRFGYALAISGDGNTLVISARNERSKYIGVINSSGFPNNIVGSPNFDDNTGKTLSGAVYVFTRDNIGLWKQQAFIKSSSPGRVDHFGRALALSRDGLTLAVGSPNEASNQAGIINLPNSFPTVLTDKDFVGGGAVHIFKRIRGDWHQQALIKPTNADFGDEFGGALSLSDDGLTLVVGARSEESNKSGVMNLKLNPITPSQGFPTITTDDDSIVTAGAAYVFISLNDRNKWIQQSYIKASNSDIFDAFGTSIALSGDGKTLVIGASVEGSNQTGIVNNTGFPTSPDMVLADGTGAVYVYDRDLQDNWSLQAYIKGSLSEPNFVFGSDVKLSQDGSILVVASAPLVKFNTTVGVYIFTRNASSDWVEKTYLKSSNQAYNDYFGSSIALSRNGKILAVGATSEDSHLRGVINGSGFPTLNNDNIAANRTGAVYLFSPNSAGIWVQQSYIKASNAGSGDKFGNSIALSGNGLTSQDGNTLAVSALFEAGYTTGVTNNHTTPDNDDTPNTGSGAVYLY